jgi:oligopeptide transport system substrate-binding protein
LASGPDWWKDAKNLIGNGTHIVQTFDGKTKITLTPSQNYWRGVAKTDIQITGLPKADYPAAFKKGDLDMVTLGDFTADDYAELRKDDSMAKRLLSAPTSCTFVLMFRTNQKPFDDIKVRQAFSTALDRSRAIKEIFGDESVPATSWLPPGVQGFNPNENRYSFNLDEARKRLAESKYKTAKALPPIVFLYNKDFPTAERDVNKLITQFKEAFPEAKIEALGKTQDEVQALRRNPESKISMFWTSGCLSYGEATTFLADYWSNGGRGNRLAVWSSKAFDEAAAKAASEPDPAKRASLNQQAESILLEEAPQINVSYFANVVLMQPNVKTGPTSPVDIWRGSADRLLWDIE